MLSVISSRKLYYSVTAFFVFNMSHQLGEKITEHFSLSLKIILH